MLGRYTTGPSDEGGGYQNVPRYPRGPMPIIDLRSDTVTKPTPGDAPGDGRGRGRRRRLRGRPDRQGPRGARRRAARQGGRPVRRLGAMGNLVAQMAHVQRGAEVDRRRPQPHRPARGGELRRRGRAFVRPIASGPTGRSTSDEVREAFRDPTDVHDPITGLVVFENASAHANNQPVPSSYVAGSRRVAHDGGVPLHIDGARFWNAVVALDEDPRELAGPRTPSRSACRRASPARSGACSSARRTSSGRPPRPEAARRRDAPGRGPRGRGARGAPGRRRGDDRSAGRRPRQRPPPRRGAGRHPRRPSPRRDRPARRRPARPGARPHELRAVPGRARPRGVPRGARAARRADAVVHAPQRPDPRRHPLRHRAVGRRGDDPRRPRGARRAATVAVGASSSARVAAAVA